MSDPAAASPLPAPGVLVGRCEPGWSAGDHGETQRQLSRSESGRRGIRVSPQHNETGVGELG